MLKSCFMSMAKYVFVDASMSAVTSISLRYTGSRLNPVRDDRIHWYTRVGSLGCGLIWNWRGWNVGSNKLVLDWNMPSHSYL
jgi:hypothetical protein